MEQEEKEIQHRQRKGIYFIPLCQALSANLNRIINDLEKHNQKIHNNMISKMTFSAERSVSNWLNGKALPNVEQLYILSEFFHASIDSLLDKEMPLAEREFSNLTYWDVFMLLVNLEKHGIIRSDDIKDPFLSYLLKTKRNIEDRDSISIEKKNKWYEKVKKDFSIHVFDAYYLDLYYKAALDAFAEIEEYDTYVSCLHALFEWNKVRDHVGGRPENDDGLPLAPEDHEFSLDPFYEWARYWNPK